MHREITPISFISAISVLIVVPWHWRARNIATLSLAFWLFITNIVYGIDAAIWSDNVDIVVPVWCDITTKLIIGSNFALPAACLCICIHLERVASIRQAKTSRSDKRRRQVFEAFMTFGLPIFFMALHYVVQGHRFDIIEEYGCRPTTYFSIPSIFIVWLPPLLMSIVSLVFAALALRHFMIRRFSFAAHLNVGNSTLTTSRYLRLMLMAALQMIWGVTVTAYALWFTVIAVPIRPWTTWADVHSDFLRVDQYPALVTPKEVLTGFYVLWSMLPISTFIFVVFFAFGRDAVEEYKKCWLWFHTRILHQSVPTKRSFMNKFTTGWLKSDLASSGKTAVASTISSPPPYKAPMPPSPTQCQSDFIDLNKRESRCDVSQYKCTDKSFHSHDRDSFIDISSPHTTPSVYSTTPMMSQAQQNEIPLQLVSPPSLPAPPRYPRQKSSLLR